MSKNKQTPDANGEDANSPSKTSFLVRILFFVAVIGNLVTIYRSVALATPSNKILGTPDNAESLTFHPPKINQKVPNANTKQKSSKHKRKRIQQKSSEHKRKPIKPLSFPLTHFLSHIPKTGVEYAAMELSSLMLVTIPLPGNKTIGSIKINQYHYNETLSKPKNFNGTDSDWLYFHKNSRDHDHANPESDAYAPPFICNMGTTPIRSMAPYYFGYTKTNTEPKKIIHDLKFRCSLIASESPWNERAQNVYTVIRDPVSHVISQYFHCSDSNHHKLGHLMPPLDEWLNAYAELSESMPLQTRPPYTTRWRAHPEAQALRNKFMCYNPIDSESDYVKFPAKVVDGGGRRMVLPEGYTYPYPYPYHPGSDETQNPPPRDEETRQIDKQLFNDLKSRFKVIGEMSQMIKTVCAIFIDLTEGKYIPTPCDCTHTNDNKQQSSSTFKVPNLYSPDGGRGNPRYSKVLLDIGYDSTKHSHGVKTHGSDFAKEGLTPFQKTQIVEQLRPLDVVLYNVSRDVFDAQVSELEEAHGIKICDAAWNRESEVIEVIKESRKKGKNQP